LQGQYYLFRYRVHKAVLGHRSQLSTVPLSVEERHPRFIFASGKPTDLPPPSRSGGLGGQSGGQGELASAGEELVRRDVRVS
jgi:hypothetical protein